MANPPHIIPQGHLYYRSSISQSSVNQRGKWGGGGLQSAFETFSLDPTHCFLQVHIDAPPVTKVSLFNKSVKHILHLDVLWY